MPKRTRPRAAGTRTSKLDAGSGSPWDQKERLLWRSLKRNWYEALEGEFCGKLNAARSATPEEWIADADIPGGSNVVVAVANFAVTHFLKSICCRIGDKRRKHGICEVGMIYDVEEFSPQLQVEPFRDSCVLVEREI